ncbi:hypothetical protein CFIMG_003108RA [Ceratocystis fimbriata CBS 114723]|uniref:Uncharacterized protein n=1 Tax=Ceratocystis fimbriata CBS 114723 TaxID=1035309 RepID=A0A2C5WV11_9PEZI|nr:hypothetical protein CFIMG_003108RA [Ceratocystis fimbriata CBS 114723]
MTAVALDCDQDFHQLVRVANKVVQVRNAAWPRLYATSVRFFFENKRYTDAVECHKMLAPMFDPGPLVFGDIITRFVINHDTECQAALKSIYSHSNYRDLYDKIVPLLHRRGKEVAARDWRSLFLQYHDRPRSMASSPFIRFLNRYFPNEGLCEEEMMVLNPPSTSRNSVPVSPGRGTMANSADYACNKPPPNDRLIARWFASEWSSIGFSFTVIQKLGVKQIGSFSLQSLGLRCNSCLELLSWVKELKGLGITVTQSNYSSVVLRAARSKNDQQLLEILQSDVHPDVFEDVPTLQKILTASAAIGDWNYIAML